MALHGVLAVEFNKADLAVEGHLLCLVVSARYRSDTESRGKAYIQIYTNILHNIARFICKIYNSKAIVCQEKSLA